MDMPGGSHQDLGQRRRDAGRLGIGHGARTQDMDEKEEEGILCSGRSPSRGAWIEIWVVGGGERGREVAPPRGERGLKFADAGDAAGGVASLPLVGSVS